jgi:aryl-alcohol dehydrogenase-like predicted oxidoreductase
MTSMEQRPVGSQGMVASAQGLGCMGMTAFYVADPSAHEAEALETLDKALELGVTFLDTAWVYQHASGAKNEALVAKALAKHGRSKFIVATKFGIDFSNPSSPYDSSPAMIRKQLAESLARLGTDYIDLYYQHRQDPRTPVETVMETLKELVAEGKIKYVGLSEVTAEELRRAHKVFPVTAIQMEWSLHTRDIEKEIVPTARELGVAIVAYSPLGRGLLTPRFTSKESFKEGDWRAKLPRVAGSNLETNAKATARLDELAARHGATAAQLALAWVHSRGKDVFPIPGTKTAKRLEENAAAVELSKRLTAADYAEIEAAVPEAVGERYEGMAGTWNSRQNAGAGDLGGV